MSSKVYIQIQGCICSDLIGLFSYWVHGYYSQMPYDIIKKSYANSVHYQFLSELEPVVYIRDQTLQ